MALSNTHLLATAELFSLPLRDVGGWGQVESTSAEFLSQYNTSLSLDLCILLSSQRTPQSNCFQLKERYPYCLLFTGASGSEEGEQVAFGCSGGFFVCKFGDLGSMQLITSLAAEDKSTGAWELTTKRR